MTPHKFAVGQKVTFQPARGDARQAHGRFTVVRTLPSETRDQQYRVKNDHDGHERVVLESQLAASPVADTPWDPWTVKPKSP
jgi:hypothetical protein